MILSSFVYLSFAFILYKLGAIIHNLKIYRSSNITYKHVLIFTFVLFALISGLRYRVGADYIPYYKYFYQVCNGGYIDSIFSGFEPIFVFVTKILSSFNSVILYFATWAFIQIYFTYHALKNRSYLYPFLGLILILGPYYLSWMNGIRQTMAACIFIWASTLLVDKRKIFSYICIIIITSFLHKSALLLLIFIFLPPKNWLPNRYICIIILLSCAICGQLAIIRDHLDFAENILQNLGYDSYANSFDNILSLDDTQRAYGPRRIVLLLSSILILWYKDDMKSLYKDKFFTYSLNLFFIYCCSTDLLSNVSNLFLRPFLYLEPFALISTAYLLTYLKIRYGIYRKKSYIFWFALFCSCSYLMIDCIANINTPNEYSLYKFIFLEI